MLRCISGWSTSLQLPSSKSLGVGGEEDAPEEVSSSENEMIGAPLQTCDQTNAEDGLFFSMAINGFVGGIKFKVESL